MKQIASKTRQGQAQVAQHNCGYLGEARDGEAFLPPSFSWLNSELATGLFGIADARPHGCPELNRLANDPSTCSGGNRMLGGCAVRK